MQHLWCYFRQKCQTPKTRQCRFDLFTLYGFFLFVCFRSWRLFRLDLQQNLKFTFALRNVHFQQPNNKVHSLELTVKFALYGGCVLISVAQCVKLSNATSWFRRNSGLLVSFWIGTAKLFFYKGKNKCMLSFFSCRQFFVFLLTALTYEVWTGSVERKTFLKCFQICTASEVTDLHHRSMFESRTQARLSAESNNLHHVKARNYSRATDNLYCFNSQFSTCIWHYRSVLSLNSHWQSLRERAYHEGKKRIKKDWK